MKFKFLVVASSLLAMAFGVFAQQFQNLQPTQAIQLRVAGSSVVDTRGVLAGNIEAVAVDPQSDQVLFAMVSTDYPSNRLTVTPIPWQLLKHRDDAREELGIPGTYQQFRVATDRLTILRAPRIRLPENTNDASWMLASYQYFNGQGASVGGVTGTAGLETGGAAGAYAGSEAAPGYAPGYSAGYPAGYVGGGGYYGGSNLSPLDGYLLYGSYLYGPEFLTNAFSTNIFGTNLFTATNIVNSLSNFLAANPNVLSNFFLGNPLATNIFGTNAFPTAGTFTNGFDGFGTNLFGVYGSNLFLLQSNFLSTFQSNPPAFTGTNFFGRTFPNQSPILGGTNQGAPTPRFGAPGNATGVERGGFNPAAPNLNPATPSPTTPTPVVPRPGVAPGTPVPLFPKQPLPTPTPATQSPNAPAPVSPATRTAPASPAPFR